MSRLDGEDNEYAVIERELQMYSYRVVAGMEFIYMRLALDAVVYFECCMCRSGVAVESALYMRAYVGL